MSAGYDGSINIDTKLNSKGFNAGTKQITAGLGGITASLRKLAGAIGLAFGASAIINFGKASVEAATDLSNALIGLKSIVDGQGKSFDTANDFIQSYISDGLVPATHAVTAYKNLLSRGYDTEQIEIVLTRLKDAAAFGRQASYSLGEAVTSATEGLKNENSILVDNAGVTKNVAKMWDDYAKSIGTTANNLTKQQKIQAEVLGIMEETRFQVGDAAKVADTFSGQILKLQFNFNNLKVAVGNAVMPIVQAVLPGINSMIEGFTRVANIVAQFTTALFGKQAKAQEDVTKTASAGAAAENKLAKATTAAGKAAKGALAGFDELNVLQSETAAGLAGVIGVDDLNVPAIQDSKVTWEVEVSDDIQRMADKVRDTFDEVLEVVGTIGVAILTWKLSSSLISTLNTLSKLKPEEFKKAFDNFKITLGITAVVTGIVLGAENIKSILSGEYSATSITSGIKELISGALIGGGLMAIGVSAFALPISIVLTVAITEIVTNWEEIKQYAAGVWKAIKSVFTGDNEGFWEGVTEAWIAYLKMDTWTNKLAKAIVGEDLWNNLKEYLEDGGSVRSLFEGVWDNVKSWFNSNVVGFFTETIPETVTGWVDVASKFFTDGIPAMIENIRAWFAEAPGKISEELNRVAESISIWVQNAIEWVKTEVPKIIQSITARFSEVAGNVGRELGKCAGTIATWAENAITWVKTEVPKVVQSIVNWFATLPNRIKTAIDGFKGKLSQWGSDSVGWVSTEVPKIVNSIVDWFAKLPEMLVTVGKNLITGLWNGIISAGKWLKEQISSFFGGLWGGVGDFFTGFGEGFSASYVPVPKLATGAVIPPNAEFLAILGDQKHGRNIEAPEGLIRQIIQEELSELNLSPQITIKAEQEAGLIRYLKFKIDGEGQRAGAKFVKVGG